MREMLLIANSHKRPASSKQKLKNFLKYFMAGNYAVKRHLVLSILTGLFLVLIFPDFPFWFLAWVALLPLLLVIYETEPMVSFFYGWLAGAIFFLGLIYWLLALYPIVGFLAVLAWFSLAIFEGLFLGVFAFGASIIRRNYVGWGRLFVIPAWWVSVEFARGAGWWKFPWGFLGYSQQPFGFLTQIAAITGVYGISFLIVMVSVSLIELFLTPIDKKKYAIAYVAVAFIIFFEVVGSGFIMLKSGAKDDTASRKAKAHFRVVAVQGNIFQEEKWDPGKEDYIKNVYYHLTKRAEDYKPYLVIWPETAVPSFLLRDTFYLSKLKDLAKRNGNYLLVGSLHLDNESKQYNSAILITPKGKVQKRYDKLSLVLFGEYIPFRFMGDILRRFTKLAWLGESITGGKDYTVFTTGKGRLSTVICFESADSNLCRQMVKKGAQLLTVITNDAWFGKSAAGTQHLQISSFRAIENNMYVVQVANTGVSAIISPRGCVLKKTPLFQRQLLSGALSFRRSQTFYLRWGDLFAYFCLLLAAGCFVSPLLTK